MSKRDERDRQKKHREQWRRKREARKAESPLPPASPPLMPLRPPVTFALPPSWPGADDPHLARADLLKAEVGEFVIMRSPGPERLRQFEDRLRRGPLSELRDLRDWAMEELLWHGLPGDSWHPIDTFLAARGPSLSPAAREMLQRWKRARIGLFLVGEVTDGAVTLHEFDPYTEERVGPPLRAVTLNMGGADVYRRQRNSILLTYVAPWGPEEDRVCGLGYGVCGSRDRFAFLMFHLGLRHPEVVTRPLPWKVSREAGEAALREWKAREWHAWLSERLQFPFWAIVGTPPEGEPDLRQVSRLLPSTPEQARQTGIYFEVPPRGPTWTEAALAAGGTTVSPVDVTGPNLLPMLEYHAYRERVGPPPGVAGGPSFVEL